MNDFIKNHTEPFLPCPVCSQPTPARVVLRHAEKTAAPDPVRTALEEAAKLVDAECERILSKQVLTTAGDMVTQMAVNANLRMIAVMLPEISASIRALRAAPQPSAPPLPPRDTRQARVPLADHDEIGRKILSLPWAIQKMIVTITAHCRVLSDDYPDLEVADLAGCISQETGALAAAILSLLPAEGGAREGLASVAFTLGWTDLKGMTVDQMAGRLRDAARFAASAIDRHLGDSDPANGSDDPLFIALQKLSAALGPSVTRANCGGET